MRFGVVTFPGSNCDADCRWVLREVVGVAVEAVWHEETDLSGLDAVVLPGGFSYGDYLRAGAIAATSPVMQAVRAFAARGGLVLGICNGFQILLETKLLPGALLPNLHARFRCEWVQLRVERTDTPFTSRYRPQEVVRMPIAHQQGRYYADPETLRRLEATGCVVFRYEGTNPNGSLNGIAGICNEAGTVLGLMPHPERCAERVLGGEDGRRLFESMVDWIRTRRREAVWSRS